MFVNSDYLDYKYLVSVSDNYVVLTNTRSVSGSWDHPQDYDVIYQYFYPSYLTLESYQTSSTTKVFSQVDVDDNYWNRPDVFNLLACSFIIVIITCFVINQVTEFVKRGGLFS